MKIKLYVVTYNAKDHLEQTLESIFKSDSSEHHLEINIINNHSNFYLKENFIKKINILHNTCRPDFSTGHLSRNWNQAIINGFKDLNNPDCDILITCQDDTEFDNNWFHKLIIAHKKYDFISMGAGDNFCSYTVDAIKNIGIWDERFCNIGYQEADYFLRSLIYNNSKSSINDFTHIRSWNPLDTQFIRRPAYEGFLERSHNSFPYHDISLRVFNEKYPGIAAAFWNQELFDKIKDGKVFPHIATWMMYPYFEKDILNLKDKKYVQMI